VKNSLELLDQFTIVTKASKELFCMLDDSFVQIQGIAAMGHLHKEGALFLLVFIARGSSKALHCDALFCKDVACWKSRYTHLKLKA
jgi:hypothetical protein